MRHRIHPVLKLAIVLALAAGVVSQASADRRSVRENARARLKVETFATTLEFSGPLQGDIATESGVVRLAPDVFIYELGNGVLSPGSFVDHRMIYVSGVMVGGTPVITHVLVRPPAAASSAADGTSPNVSEASGQGPR
jgi:hypothetical protein